MTCFPEGPGTFEIPPQCDSFVCRCSTKEECNVGLGGRGEGVLRRAPAFTFRGSTRGASSRPLATVSRVSSKVSHRERGEGRGRGGTGRLGWSVNSEVHIRVLAVRGGPPASSDELGAHTTRHGDVIFVKASTSVLVEALSLLHSATFAYASYQWVNVARVMVSGKCRAFSTADRVLSQHISKRPNQRVHDACAASVFSASIEEGPTGNCRRRCKEGSKSELGRGVPQLEVLSMSQPSFKLSDGH